MQRRDVLAVAEHGLAGALDARREALARAPSTPRSPSPCTSTTCGSMCSAISSRGAPSAMMRPWSMIARRWHSRSASSMKCVVSRSVLPSCVQAAQPLPDQVARLRIEAGGRLVQEHELRVVDQRARERQAALHAAGERLILASPRPARPANSSSARDARRDLALRKAEVAAVDQQVLGDGEIGVEVVELRHHADARARLARARAAPARRAARSRRASGSIRPRQSLSVVVLPAPFGPSRPKHSPGATARSTPRDHLGAVVATCAAPRTDSALIASCAWTMRAQDVQLAVEEMIGARHHDHRQLLRPRPVEHRGERHGLVVLAVDHQRARAAPAAP